MHNFTLKKCAFFCRVLDENVRLYSKLLGETLAVHAYMNAVRKLQESPMLGQLKKDVHALALVQRDSSY
jgi:hypothetical protein